ncbi:MAG TPA: FG-GAP-like repeat-containing protein [Rhizomicrobium sp.]|jgi:Ca2+-binding RTX toxin-like protein
MSNAALRWRPWDDTDSITLGAVAGGDGFDITPPAVAAAFPQETFFHTPTALSLVDAGETQDSAAAPAFSDSVTPLIIHAAATAPAPASDFDLTTLNGVNGFTLSGAIGFPSVGDINGDGSDDILASANATSTSGIFGHHGVFQSGDFTTISASSGFSFPAQAFPGGDINGDGIDDLIATGGRVVFGETGKFKTLDFTDLDGTNGFTVTAPHSDPHATITLLPVGDINGDGFSDLAVTSLDQTTHTSTVDVMFGHAAPFPAHIDPSTLTATEGFQIDSTGVGAITGEQSAGDVNGDGIDDLLVTTAKKTYVIFGHSGSFSQDVQLASLDGKDGFAIRPGSPCTVTSLGDINGDGCDDLIVYRPFSSEADVVLGHTGSFASMVDAKTASGSSGFTLSNSGVNFGVVASAGDFNGDGFDDFLVGAPDSDKAYLFYGSAKGLSAIQFDGPPLTHLVSTYGTFAVYSGTIIGTAVSSGDINGDGFSDVIIGAGYGYVTRQYGHSYYQVEDSTPGTLYTVFGHAPNEAVTRVGTDAANTIHGGNFNDTLSGLGGDDTLIGQGGNDKIDGGDGDDHLIGGGGRDILAGDAGNDLIEGGPGNNVLKGGDGEDTVIGGPDNDEIHGGMGKDLLIGGGGNDTFVYHSVAESTGKTADTIRGFDPAHDKIDLPVAVTAIDPIVRSGTLDHADFNSDLKAAIGSAQLGAHHAVLFSASAGDLAGHLYLVVDANGVAGFQANADYVIQLQLAANPGKIAIGNFI